MHQKIQNIINNHNHVLLCFPGFWQFDALQLMLQKIRNVRWVDPLITLYLYLIHGAEVKTQ